MNKEIKEYLDSANFKFKDVDEEGNEVELTLSEELEKLIEDNTKLANYITNLQEENKKLNEVIEALKETNHLLINQKYKLEYELDMLDEKREKAIELYKNCKEEDWCTLPLDMINILQNGSEK